MSYFDPKCGFNSRLYHKALAETLYSQYGEHVLEQAPNPISEQYFNTRGEKILPSKQIRNSREGPCADLITDLAVVTL